MHSKTADCASGTATWRTRLDKTYVTMWKHDVVHNNNSKLTNYLHNVMHYRQRRTEQRSQVTRTENLAKIGCVAFRYMSKQTDRPTDTQTRWSQYFTALPRAKYLTRTYHSNSSSSSSRAYSACIISSCIYITHVNYKPCVISKVFFHKKISLNMT